MLEVKFDPLLPTSDPRDYSGLSKVILYINPRELKEMLIPEGRNDEEARRIHANPKQNVN